MLHGKIEVNGVAIAYWEAVNVDNIMTGAARYDCKVFYRNKEGHPLHAEFQVVGFEQSGPVALAGTIMRTAYKNMKGYPPGGPDQFPV